MTKPDWAERLQRSRKREYDKGWADCEARIIKQLEVLWQKTQGTDIPAVVVLPEAIALIKGEQE